MVIVVVLVLVIIITNKNNNNYNNNNNNKNVIVLMSLTVLIITGNMTIINHDEKIYIRKCNCNFLTSALQLSFHTFTYRLTAGVIYHLHIRYNQRLQYMWQKSNATFVLNECV